MNNGTHNGLLMLGCFLVSPFVLAANPRKAMDLLGGRDWNSGHCSCTNDWARDPNCAVHGGKR